MKVDDVQWLTDTGDSVLLTVFVSTGGSNARIMGVDGDALRIQVPSGNEEGAIHKKVSDFLELTLKLSKPQILFMGSHHSRKKKIRLEGIKYAKAYFLLMR